MNGKNAKQQASKELPLDKAAQIILDETRMLLPGIQALFGFQLIAVFNQAFGEKLSSGEQRLHLLAIALVVLTTIIIMTPAAYHRQMEVQDVTDTFIHLATRLMLLSMVPLSISICLDFFLVSRLILNNAPISALFASGLFVLFIAVWFVLPRIKAFHQTLAGKQ